MVAPPQNQHGHGSPALPQTGHAAQRIGNVSDSLQSHSRANGRSGCPLRANPGADQLQRLGRRLTAIQSPDRTSALAQKSKTPDATLAPIAGPRSDPKPPRPT